MTVTVITTSSAPQTIAVVAEQDAAERAEQEADAEGGEGRQHAHAGIDAGEELGVENDGGDEAVEQEVIPVDHAPAKLPIAARRDRRNASVPRAPGKGRGGSGFGHAYPPQIRRFAAVLICFAGGVASLRQ